MGSGTALVSGTHASFKQGNLGNQSPTSASGGHGSGLFNTSTSKISGGGNHGRNHQLNNHYPHSTMHEERHKKISYKIEFLNPGPIDSIPIDHKHHSMLNRKTMPGGKKIP